MLTSALVLPLALASLTAAAPIVDVNAGVGAAAKVGSFVPVDAAVPAGAAVAARDDPLTSLVIPLVTPVLQTLEGAVNQLLPQIANTLASNSVTGDSLTPVVQALADVLTTANSALSALDLPIQLRKKQLDSVTSVLEVPTEVVGGALSAVEGVADGVVGSTGVLRKKQLDAVSGVLELPTEVVGEALSTVGGVAGGVVGGALRKKQLDAVSGVLEVPTEVVGGALSTVEGTVGGVLGGALKRDGAEDEITALLGQLLNLVNGASISTSRRRRAVNNLTGLIDAIEGVFKKRQLQGIEAIVSGIVTDVATTLSPLVDIIYGIPGAANIINTLDGVLDGLLKALDKVVPGLIDAVASDLPEPVQSTLKGLGMQLTLGSLGL